MSALDFVRLNNKDQLLNPDLFATKNDGSQQFINFRDHHKSVSSAAFTLDKVMVLKVLYTVLVSYFFQRGRIHALTNALHVMKLDEYVGKSSAQMVGLDLMASLGLSRKQIGKIFHHGVYDGVYSTAEERAHGGGCLSLLNHFAEWCNTSRENITGLWDMGHKLQLVFGYVMTTNKKITDLNKVIFNTMSDYSHGQQSLLFQELSDELRHATQTNKSTQETRWARANLRAYTSLFRNIPTLYILIADERKLSLLPFSTQHTRKK